MTEAENFILIVLPDDMKKVMLDAFQEYGCPFSYEIVSTVVEARKILSQNSVHAIIMTKSVALLGDDGTDGLMTTQSDLPPTITLIQQGDGYPDYLYHSHKNNDWVTVPFDLQELYIRVSSVIDRENKQ
jgi:DNA-binding response OmpR family regulator